MPSSIAKREKLVGPVQLGLIGGLFAVSFAFLLPKQDAFVIADGESGIASDVVVGELDIAYLKARNSSGEQSLDETSRAVSALVRSGQVDAARTLLQNRPNTAITEGERFSLDLDIASAEYFAATDATTKQTRHLQLLNRVELLLTKPALQSLPHLQRGVQLSEQLGQHETTIALYKLLASTDVNNASHWYSKCAKNLGARAEHVGAARCLDQAIAATNNSETNFDLNLDLLAHLSIIGHQVRLSAVLDELVKHQPLSNAQREKLASAMLAYQRPDQAHLVYQQLALNDESNSVKWLSEAAKWAEASNQTLTAATYIEQAAGLSEGIQKLALVEQASALLMAAGESKLAFDRLKSRIDGSPNDISLLQEGVVLARQLGQVDQAVKWNQQLIILNPSSADAINTQVELALASGDLRSALKWSKLAIDTSPDAQLARLRYAQVLEWNGDPVAAQREWEWLVVRSPSQNNLSQLTRVAELNQDINAAQVALYQLVKLSPNNANILKLVNFYELDGTPMRAAGFLKERQKISGNSPFIQRELARLYQHHVLYPEALSAWSAYAARYGRGTEETLNRMELSWRLRKPEASAEIARYLIGTGNASEATDVQISLISEIAWRYRLPDLAELVRPLMNDMDENNDKLALGQRLVQSLEDAGRDEEAIIEATRLWRNTGSTNVALNALNLAYKTGNSQGVSEIMANDARTATLRKDPAYWTLVASLHQGNRETKAAIAALNQALILEPENLTALSGLLWALIDAQDVNAIAAFIEKNQNLAENAPELWSPFAIAHLQLGLPELSLTWFDRQLDRIEADYNMLLTFADALEYAGRAEPARKVRLYTIKRLRPALTKGSGDDHDELIRQYAQLVTRYGSAEDNERQAQLLLRSASNDANKNGSAQSEFWREDIAISWLMATQRHEQARLVMARIHEQRLQAPAWQELSVAMGDNDVEQIQQLINGTGSISIGNHILALRQIGYDKQAYDVARNAINNAPNLSDRDIARSQFSAMRSERPSYSAGTYSQTTMSGLGISESGFKIRHTFNSTNLGFSLDYKQRGYTSTDYDLTGNDVHQDIAVTLFHGNRRIGGELTAGFLTSDANGIPYALAKQHVQNLDGSRTLSAQLAYNEPSTSSALLRLTAKQNRLTLGYEQSLGFREYMRLEGAVTDINTHVQEKRIARGLAARVEFGLRGAFASNVWSTSVAVSRAQNDIVTELPEELALSQSATIDSILADKATSLIWGASFSRGGIQGEYPQASSPRYYFNANIGQTWPDAGFGAQFDGGAGVRVLGGDELSIDFALDTQPLNTLRKENDTTSIGVNYRYHF